MIDQGGDYSLGLKGNQGDLHEATEDFFNAAQQADWGIENRLHWRLDVTFREDESRIRKAMDLPS